MYGSIQRAKLNVNRNNMIVDAHRDDGRRFIVRADESLSAFVELEREVLTTTFYLHPFNDSNRNQTASGGLESLLSSGR